MNNWEEEFDEMKTKVLVSSPEYKKQGSKIKEVSDYVIELIKPSLKNFIRKVEKEAYERERQRIIKIIYGRLEFYRYGERTGEIKGDINSEGNKVIREILSILNDTTNKESEDK